ncbi:Rv2231c family pyridoxal phosphate-dependent protein CobC [Corynebacterium sp. H78]|uniref:Rv2231c family pyridoxal phosphate-dependent protein CobC n=1 Tax=Corynebacterium sp. H78 TaxID=3133417 RepID=UPI0030B5CC3C
MSTSGRPVPADLLRYHGDVASRTATIDFAVNVRGSMPDWLTHALTDSLGELSSYPDPALDAKVRTALATNHGVHADNILLLSGAAEGFSLLPDLLVDESSQSNTPPAIVYPQFTEPEVAFAAADVTPEQVITDKPWDIAQVSSSTRRWPMLVVGNPTNPTSLVHSRADVLALRGHTDLLVVDEAFMDVIHSGDYPGGVDPSVAGCVNDELAGETQGELLVLRSMTKTWALAGLRCGYAIGTPETLARLAKRRPAWPMGTIQMRAMLAIATHGPAELPTIRDAIKAERKDMVDILRDAEWSVAPGQGPFVLATPPVANAEVAREYLHDRGIAVRRCDTFPGLDSSWWRLAVRESAQVRTLVAAVHSYVKGTDHEH